MHNYQNNFNNIIEKVEYFFISNNERFLNNKRKNVIILSNNEENVEYDEDHNFNNIKSKNLFYVKNKKFDFKFELLSDSEEEFNFIKKFEDKI